MNKQGKLFKLLPVWIAISAVVILAGIIVMALFGYNNSSDIPESNVFEVQYNIVVKNSEEMKDTLEEICTDAFKENGLTVLERYETTGSGNSSNWSVRYTFASGISAEKRTAVESAIDGNVASQILTDEYAEVFTVWHTEKVQSFYEASWRGGVAVAVGAIVALIYVGIRFGVGSALTGLTLAVHDGLFTVALLAAARIPVYTAAIAFYAGIAALLSIILWLFTCMKLRDLSKESASKSLDAQEAVAAAAKGSRITVAVVAGAVALCLAVLGGVATAGVRAIALPALVAVAAAAYSSLVLGPALHVHVKGAFDKFKAKRKVRYTGKQKQTQE